MYDSAQNLNTNAARSLANEPTRKYTQPAQKGFKHPPVARFKCKIWFVDGNKKCFYSFDNKETIGGQTVKDEYEGLIKLLRYINKCLKAERVKTAMIWLNTDDVPVTRDGKYDFQVYKATRYTAENEDINFLPSGVVDLNYVKHLLAKRWRDSQKQRKIA